MILHRQMCRFYWKDSRMKKIAPILVAITLVFCGCARNGSDPLYGGFREPPAVARPFVRWWWNGNYITAPEITRQLDLLEAAGIGGVEINPIALHTAAHEPEMEPVSWLSPQWNRLLRLTAEQAHNRGMIADLIVGSGWPFGGRFLESDQTIKGVGLNKVALDGPMTYRAAVSELIKGPGTKFELQDAPQPQLMFVRLARANPAQFEPPVDLLDRVDADGILSFDVPEGKNILYVGAWQRSFRSVMHGAAGADGPVLDHYNQAAVEDYLNRMSETLGPVLGGRMGNRLRAMFCDSIELSGANWADDLPEHFERRRGYALDPYLPYVVDRTAPEGNSQFADAILRVRYDYYKTLVELFHERFIHPFHNWCRANGTLSRYQAYGFPWLMGMLDGYMVPDIPEGDTWLFNNWMGLDEIRYAVWNKYASSGAHLTGKPLIGCENMTNTKGVFAATLEYIKQAGDLSFITGINHSILHGFNYSPPQAGFPGWIRYGTYFNEHNPWWPYLRKWTQYNSRLSWVFQQTTPVIQVAILGPTADIWSRHGLDRSPFVHTPDYLHYLWQAIHQNGCSADYINATVLKGAQFEDGLLKYGPMAYQLLIVVDVQTLEPDAAEAIAAYARAGGRIAYVGRRPDRSAGLQNALANDTRVRDAVDSAFRADSGKVEDLAEPQRKTLRRWADRLLDRMQVRRSVDISTPDDRLFQIHHRIKDRDIFFFTNMHRDKHLEFAAEFDTGGRTPWRWDAETGERYAYPFASQANRLQITLKPLESLLLVFEPDLHGRPKPRPVIDRTDPFEIEGAWDLTLKPTVGDMFERSMTELQDLTATNDPALRSFGGTAVYRLQFDAPDDSHTALSLGTVHGVSRVRLNGTPCGVRWWGEHVYDVTEALKQGRNTLEIEVATVLVNLCKSLRDNPMAQVWAGKAEPAPTGIVGPVSLYRYLPAPRHGVRGGAR